MLRLLFVAFLLHSCSSQGGEFPTPTTASQNKPVTATSTCGTDGVEAYCAYTVNAADSLAPICMEETCDDTCPFSDTSPSSINLENIGTFGSGVNLTIDRLGDPNGAISFSNSAINISSLDVPQVTDNGFTFAVWVKQATGNSGTLLSKSNDAGTQITYSVSITESTLTFSYLPDTMQMGFSSLTVKNLDLSSDYWHHISVTVYDDDFALYVNGSVVNATGLAGALTESANNMIYLGQTAPGLSTFNGKMDDIYFFSQALTEREIEEVVFGVFPAVTLSSYCHCPPSHPVINSISPSNCIQHTGVITARGSAQRINSNSHTEAYVNDNNFVTTWIPTIDEPRANVTVSLVEGTTAAYQLIFVFIRYGTPPPKAAILEKSINGGKTYVPMQYFADDCQQYFGMENDATLQTPDDVNCITEYSKQEQGTGVIARVRFVNVDSRPESSDINSSPKLREFILADHVRLNFVDFFTTNTTEKHRYYSVSEIIVAARCECNGHAARCSSEDVDVVCDCIHNTQGDRCEQCLPLYNDKPWSEGVVDNDFACKACDCNNHGTSCYYNASLDAFPGSYELGGGGYCTGCLDNTAGPNCETCVEGYYRPPGVDSSDDDPCSPCQCNTAGSNGIDCVKNEGIAGEVAGQCSCKDNVEGLTCDTCKDGYFDLSSNNLEGCQECQCNTDGTINGLTTCNEETGQCLCKQNVEGLKCDQCINGTQGLSAEDPNGCSTCDCNSIGSIDNACDSITGQCQCKQGVTGVSCDVCMSGYYGFSSDGCQECSCSEIGAVNNSCNVDTGICSCFSNFSGDACSECAVNFYNFSAGCLPCDCDASGTLSDSLNECDTDGQCNCKTNVQGRTCDTCKSTYTNLEASNDQGCSSCSCVISNTDVNSGVCDPVTSECYCLDTAMGATCNICRDGYYTQDTTCVPCVCDSIGATNNTCNAQNGDCICVNSRISGSGCDSCQSGHYSYPECLECGCNTDGSIDVVCDNITGLCKCKEFVVGMNCDSCVDGFSLLDPDNPFGCTKAPEEQSPPLANLIGATYINLAWNPPEKPNGVLTLYRVYRDEVAIASVIPSSLAYNDTGLFPFIAYTYQIEAVNVLGSAISESMSFTTLEAAPEEVNAPNLQAINDTSISASWMMPNITNGIITSYSLSLVAIDGVPLDTQIVNQYDQSLSAVVTNLTPFTSNTFKLTACTSGGCADSGTVSVTTNEAAPDFQPPPTVTSVNSSVLSLNWTAPPQPNGIVITYEIYIRYEPFIGDGEIVQTVNATINTATVHNLEPFTIYEISVISYTSAGGAQSNWTSGMTDESSPEGIATPELSVLSSSEILIKWFVPAKPNGIIEEYRIFLYNNTDAVVTSNATGEYIVTELSPFTEYQFYVVVCTSAGCGMSETVAVTTFENVPSGLSAPDITGGNSTSISLSWKAPTYPNGIITQYFINRTQPSLLSIFTQRDLGNAFYGTGYASFTPGSDLSGFSSTVSLLFKTFQPDGILVYSIDSVNTDFIAIELRSGIPWFLFDVGSGSAAIATSGNKRFDDGKWHKLVATREGRNGEISVDDSNIGIGSSLGTNTILGALNVLYIGGLADGAALATVSANSPANATLEGQKYAGCIFDIHLGNTNLNLSASLNENSGVGSIETGCFVNMETGVSFLGGGYFSVPITAQSIFTISFNFRTSYPSGILLFHYGSSSHLLLSLEDSHLVLRVSGIGTGEFLLTSNDIPSHNLCDGSWHFIEIIKENDGIVLRVDGQSTSNSATGITFDTSSMLYVGGIPLSSAAEDTFNNRFVSVAESFSGCLKYLEINNTMIDLKRDNKASEHVRFDGCDNSTDENTLTCYKETYMIDVKLTTDHIDTSVAPFTDYLYQLIALNSAGSAYSSFTIARTEPSRPTEVGSVSVVAQTSTSITVTWKLPIVSNGIIMQYDVDALPITTTGLETPNGVLVRLSLDIEMPAQQLQLTVNGLEPATNYSLVLYAATSAGSTAGPDMYHSTLEDVPFGVQAPTASSIGSQSLILTWNPPSQPNGVIISYRLYIGDISIFTNPSVVLDSLTPFTEYDYQVEACTAVGCANSSVASSMTLPGTPAGLSPPSLTELSPTSIQANWAPPSEPNGIISHYELVRVFGSDLSQEEIVFNGSELQTGISNLSPNRLYYFKVIAYNSVDSVSSDTATITTPEDIPDLIQPPSITAINSTALLVSWIEPLQPNGEIIEYRLVENGSIVFSGLSEMYTHTELEPFTVYSFTIMACTLQGCGSSIPSSGRTDEATPEGFVKPTVIDTQSNSITLQLNEVEDPNGIVTYVLYITGEHLVATGENGRITEFYTKNLHNSTNVGEVLAEDLIPFTSYVFELEIVNSAGTLLGNFTVQTDIAAPEYQAPPSLQLSTAISVYVAWMPPLYPNGIIMNYTVTLMGTAVNTYSYNDTTIATILDDLVPFTIYDVTVTSTNNEGSATSNATRILTGEIAPADMDQATIVMSTSSSILITWDPPATPNGIIANYTVFLNDKSIETINIIGNCTLFADEYYRGISNNLQWFYSCSEAQQSEFITNITMLEPFSSYNISIQACNSAGCIINSAVIGTTVQAAPTGVPAPEVTTTVNGSVFISWKEPEYPNGIIVNYTIYKAVGESPMPLITVDSSTFEYIDDDILPFTEYEYYIEAATNAGANRGNSSLILTLEAAPSGVSAAYLEAISSSTISITIFLPSTPNGIIIEYSITRASTLIHPIPIVISVPDPAPDNSTYIDENLQPYTNYTYVVTACTSAGCTEGPSSSIFTLEALPTGLATPSTILEGDMSIFVAWQPPFEPNGVITNYDCVRIDIGYYDAEAEDLPDCCQQYIDFTNETSGMGSDNRCTIVANLPASSTSFRDNEIGAYFLYSYCVIATNGAGSVASGNADVLRAQPSNTPLAGPTASAVTINSTAVEVAWIPPDVSELLGPVGGYSLHVSRMDINDSFIISLSSSEELYVVANLTPSTTYLFQVEVNNTVGTAIGNEVSATTLDGIPIGVVAPLLIGTNATSITISWVEPLFPNGEIIIYKIFMNSALVHNSTTVGSLIVTDLKPYTLYTAQVEACTVLGCTKSDLSFNRTLEAAPVGLASPTVTILGPRSALAQWMPPNQENGIITEYQLYVHIPTTCPVESDTNNCFDSVLKFSGLAFNFTVANLRPAVEYGFEVYAINGGGNVSSGVTTEMTDEDAPSFIQPPTVVPITATSVMLVWQVPSEPNGVITGYYIYRNGNAASGQVSELTYTDSSLDPYTDYDYVVEGCTSAGCTNSSIVLVTTLEAPPSGFDDPVISNIEARLILLAWFEPANKNGRSVYYTLKNDNGTELFNGTTTNVTVTDLLPYSNYSFTVSACNAAGCVDSNIVTATTLEDIPEGFAAPTIRDLSSTSVAISWELPTQPNGIIVYFILRRDGEDIFNGSAFEYDDTDLTGDVQYAYEIEAFNSVGSVTSPVVIIHTQAGIPDGVAAPKTTVLNATAILVEWTEPLKDNGEIMFYSLYVDGVSVYEALAFTYTLSNLTPFTTYTFFIEVCNQAGCASSKSVSNTTNSAAPSGLAPPLLIATSGTTVTVSWTAPSMPNGIITEYRVLRRLADNPLLVLIQFVGGSNVFTFNNQGLDAFTTYEYQLVAINEIGSSSTEWTPITTLESPPTGVPLPTFSIVNAHNVTVEWSEPETPNGIITRYELYYRELLGDLLLAVNVSSDITQAIVAGLNPYTNYEFKVTAYNGAGMADSAFELVTTAEATPEMLNLINLVTKTEDSLTLRWFPPDQPNGIISEYALYLNGKEEYRDSDTMYTIDRLDPFTGYSIQLEACTSAGCTLGVTQGFTTEESAPIGQPIPSLSVIDARSLTITWNPPLQPNGIITGYDVFRMQVPELFETNDTALATLVYTAADVANREFNDSSLTPNTGYQYAIRANNSIGSSTSSFNYIKTPEAAPEMVPAPTLMVEGIDQIAVVWDPPGSENGILTHYEVFRISPGNVQTSEYIGLNREFTDGDLAPYTEYVYYVQACTSAGCTDGTGASAVTDESIPEGFDLPDVISLSESAISVMWNEPETPNGVITLYITEITSPITVTVNSQSSVFAVNISNLQPFTVYTVTVQACTVVGCSLPNGVEVQTDESIPMFISAPFVFALGPTSVDTSWSSPTKPNGIIIRYILRRNDTIVYDGESTNYIDMDLMPNRAYAYDVQAFTSVGGGERSPSSVVTTDSDTPTNISVPVLNPISPNAVIVQWSVPGMANGDIQGYILYVNDTAVYNDTGLQFLVSNLGTFTTYSFRVEACTTTCGSSLYSFATTLEDVPTGQGPPVLAALANYTVLVTWEPPSAPNGIIISYMVQRQQVVSGIGVGPEVDVYTSDGLILQYLDDDDTLAPAMAYQYRVVGANSKGSTTSDYMSVTLPESAPEGVTAPIIINKTSSTIAVVINPPLISNGLLTYYTLYSNSFGPVTSVPKSQEEGVEYIIEGLEPYTEYSLYSEICTAAGCTTGGTIIVVTGEALPSDLNAPVATASGATSIVIEWIPPTQPNGVITGYTLWFKQPCPQPAVFSFENACTEGQYILLATTTDLLFTFENIPNIVHPVAHSSYQFILQAENSVGGVNSTASSTVTTPSSSPQVVGTVSFEVSDSTQSISLDWGNTFRYNGLVTTFIVIRDGIFLLQGLQTSAYFPNQPTGTVLTFSVRVITSVGSITTDGIPIMITPISLNTTTTTSTVATSTSAPTTSVTPTTPFYEQPPFISGMVVLAILICIVVLLIFLCFVRPHHSRKKYSTLKSSSSPTNLTEKGTLGRDDGTIRTSWSQIDHATPAPSYREVMAHGSQNQKVQSYSPEKAALLEQDYTGGEVPLQDIHIARLSKVTFDDYPPLEQLPPLQQSPSQTNTLGSNKLPVLEESPESTFMDTKV